MHIGLIRLSSMGDLILQTPWISRLKLHNPNIKITLITFDSFKGILDGHPHIDEILYISKLKGKKDINNIWTLAKQCDQNFDVLFDLHDTLRAKLLRLFLFKTPCLKVNKRSFLRWLLVKFKIDFLKDTESQHSRVINDFSFLLNSSSRLKELTDKLISETKNSNISLTSVTSSFKKDIRPYIDEDYIVFSPVASFETKRYPIKMVKNVLNSFLEDERFKNYKVLLVAGPSDDYVSELAEGKRVINLQGKTNLLETIDIIKHAKLCFTNDTGALHIAESLGVKALSIFGSTSESFGFRPHLDRSRSLSSNVSCRPCSATGSKKCPYAEYKCMEEISEKTVFDTISKMIEEKNV